jgi:hypothetical protein
VFRIISDVPGISRWRMSVSEMRVLASIKRQARFSKTDVVLIPLVAYHTLLPNADKLPIVVASAYRVDSQG